MTNTTQVPTNGAEVKIHAEFVEVEVFQFTARIRAQGITRMTDPGVISTFHVGPGPSRLLRMKFPARNQIL